MQHTSVQVAATAVNEASEYTTDPNGAPAAAGPAWSKHPAYAAARPSKRQRMHPPQAMQQGYWSEPDDAGRVFGTAVGGYNYAGWTPGSSSDDDQAMDLLVRLWSPASEHASDEHEGFMGCLQAGNMTSPSTTSPTPDELAALEASAAPAAAAALSMAPAQLRGLPVAHAWPLPPHL